jgi:DNA-binding CsgD family transcriptional regulator
MIDFARIPAIDPFTAGLAMPSRVTPERDGSDLDRGLAAAMADTLDRLGAALFLVDADGRIVHANLAGRATLAAGNILRQTAGRLVARETAADQCLHGAFAAVGRSDAATGVKATAVPLIAHDGTRHVAHVVPLTFGARRQAGTPYAAAAAVFVTEVMLDTPPSPEIIAKAYKLTPTELRILLAIVEVGGVPEVAEALGVAESTVRTHLARLFQKTATTRQTDLVKIVAGFAASLLG